MQGNNQPKRAPEWAKAASKRRLIRSIDGIIKGRSACTHEKTRTYILPACLEGNGDLVLEGGWQTECVNPWCRKLLEASS